MKALEKIIESKLVSLETKAKIVHTLIFPIIRYRYQSWTVKKDDGKKKLIRLQYDVREYRGLPDR